MSKFFFHLMISKKTFSGLLLFIMQQLLLGFLFDKYSFSSSEETFKDSCSHQMQNLLKMTYKPLIF